MEEADLERRTRSVRERHLPAHDGAALTDREAADGSLAGSLRVEARLLCGAALLVAAGPAVSSDAERELSTLAGASTTRDTPPPGERGAGPAATVRVPVGGSDDVPPNPPHGKPSAFGLGFSLDEAGAARARCLAVLIRTRRSAGDLGAPADALLSELSASGGWDPTRDERGVVVTVRGAFQGTKLTVDGESKLVSLGRIAGSHPRFALQIVLHDAQGLPAKDETDTQRAAAIVRALVAGGAPAARLKAELVGTAEPIVDPNGPRLRPRNERLDVVFVAGG
jgi:hypothetical protein